MKICRLVLLGCLVSLGGAVRAAEANPFFAMNTIAKGPPEVVVPLLKEFGYAGLGGAFGDRAMADALARAGLRFYNGYLTLTLEADVSGIPEKVRAQLEAMRGIDTVLWLAVAKLHRDLPAGKSLFPRDDDAVAARLSEIADAAAERGLKVSLYPHINLYLARFDDVLRLADLLNHPAVGVTFNLCHWLKLEGAERDPLPLLRAAGRRLMFVTINGADTGDTKNLGWDRLIQPLGEGTYDVATFLRKVRAAGYTGPIGFQGYGIKAPPREVLAKTMAAWKRMNAAAPEARP